ncbi:MAG: hypothetical protein ACI9W6_001633, partial [Motiliproteus sp.]
GHFSPLTQGFLAVTRESDRATVFYRLLGTSRYDRDLLR